MARAHRDMPKPKEVKDLTPLFDFSEDGVPHDVSGKVKRTPSDKPPVPVEAVRGRKPKAKKGPSTEMVGSKDVVSEEAAPHAEIEELDVEPMTLRMEAQELGRAYEQAKADFEKVSAAVAARSKTIMEWAAEAAEANGADAQDIVDRVLAADGLNEQLDAALDKVTEARKAYTEAHAAWEKELAEDEERAKELNELVASFQKKAPPATPVAPELMTPMQRDLDEDDAKRVAYELTHPPMSESEAAVAARSAAEKDAQEAAAHEARLKAGAKPMDRFEEAQWYGEGEKAAREAQELADVRKEIAGNPLEAPVGSPSDLAALGFNQIFIDAYEKTAADFDKIDAEKRKAGFFKKLFGGASLERRWEAARSDLESMQEDITQRRNAAIRAASESMMTPAQRETKRKSEETRQKSLMRRGRSASGGGGSSTIRVL